MSARWINDLENAVKIKTRPITAEIPTASTADVAFLLVVFFMLTLTFAVSQGLDLNLPPDGPPATIDPIESVLVEIQADASLRVDGRPLPLDRLLEYLAPKLAQDPYKPVIIHPLPDAPYGSMVTVYDELRRGRTELALAEEIRIALPTEREMGVFWQ